MGVVAVIHEGPAKPWAIEAGVLLSRLEVSIEQGLRLRDVSVRRQRYGANLLQSVRSVSVLTVLLSQLQSVVVWLLIGAATVSLVFGDLIETLAIVSVIAINSGIGFVTELRAIRSIEALRRLGRVETTVRRSGAVQRVSAEDLVPGDIVLVESGDIVTADLRLIEAAKLEANESTLTGESVPVAKHCDPLPADTPLSDRANLLFKGTSVTRGSGAAVVTGIGLRTELGRISELVLEAEGGQTPLEKRLDALARRLVWITIGVAALVGAIGILTGRELVLSIEIAIALAVAAIPEGLPIVATIALARGMWRMAKRNALVARLSAVETLGATSVILTDKTGTLTENRMTVTDICMDGASMSLGGTGLSVEGDLEVDGCSIDDGQRALACELLKIAALCNNAWIDIDSGREAANAVGDPTEVALLIAAAKLGIFRESLLESLPEVREEPFDPATRAMATFHRSGEHYVEAVKGAPEAIIEACGYVRTAAGKRLLGTEGRNDWLDLSHALARQGLRTLAIATRNVTVSSADPYQQLILLGLVGVRDPARPGVREALAACRDSGIAVVMVTGDHIATATRIASDLGLLEPDAADELVIDGRGLVGADNRDDSMWERFAAASVIARASPEQKLELIRLHQRHDRVVAMTGDGVNDAPALKQADIGIAMGRRGTQVAREAAAMILQDDQFGTIVEAVAQGRAIYSNIRKFVVYLMSCNLSEILIVGLATLAGAPLPLLPLQILFLNLVTDVFPALALGVGEGAPELMQRRPRSAREPLMTTDHWHVIVGYGITICAVVLGAMAIVSFGFGFDNSRAVTVSFLTLAFAQLWHVFNMRDVRGQFLRNEVSGNPWVWAAIVLCAGLMIGAVYVPGLAEVLGLANPGAAGWLVALGMSVVPLIVGPIVLGCMPDSAAESRSARQSQI